MGIYEQITPIHKVTNLLEVFNPTLVRNETRVKDHDKISTMMFHPEPCLVDSHQCPTTTAKFLLVREGHASPTFLAGLHSLSPPFCKSPFLQPDQPNHQVNPTIDQGSDKSKSYQVSLNGLDFSGKATCSVVLASTNDNDGVHGIRESKETGQEESNQKGLP